MEGAIVPRAQDDFKGNAPQKKKRGRTTSIVWEHFDKLKDETDDIWKTQCRHCKQIYSSAQKNGTSHLKRHMDRCPVIRESGLVFPLAAAPAVIDGGFVKQQSNRRPRSISKVWEDFEKLRAEKDDILKAQCIHCKQILSGASKHGTSHLKRHLERCPKHGNLRARKVLLSNEVRSIKRFFSGSDCFSGGGTMLKKNELSKEEILGAISTFILSGQHSVTIVEEFGFRHMMSILYPEFENVSAAAIKREIFSTYMKERDNVKELLVGVDGKICLTCGTLSSSMHKKDEFFCISARFVDNDWIMAEKIIHLSPLTHPVNGTLIADEIALCLSMWNIDNKIFGINLDSDLYDNSMVNSLKCCLLAKKKSSIISPFFQVRSCSHLFDLAIKTSLNLIDDILDRIRCGIKHIGKLASRKTKFYMIASNEFHLDTRKLLRSDAHFQWNSTYSMIDRALYYKDMLQSWSEHDTSFVYYNLSAEEWEKMAIVQRFLTVFYDVECGFSLLKHSTSNLYFRALWKIYIHLLKSVRSPSNFITVMISDLQEKFEKYWIKFNLILSCSAVLDPRYKVKFVEFCYTKIYGDKAEEFVNATVRTLYSLFDDYKPNSAIPTIAEHVIADGDEFEDYEQFLSQKSRPQEEKSQLDLYLEEPGHDLNSDINVLQYWKNSSMRYPELAAMARDVLTIPFSSISPEKKILPVHLDRNSLNPKMIRALVCLSDWIYQALEKSAGSSLSILNDNGDLVGSDEEDDDVFDDWDIQDGTFS